MKIAYVVFTIALVVLSGLPLLSSGTMNYANAITGNELISSGGNSSLSILTNESGNFSLYSNDWPNIHSNVKADFNTNISFPEIQEQFQTEFQFQITNLFNQAV